MEKYVFYCRCPYCDYFQGTMTTNKGDKGSNRTEISMDLFLVEGTRKCKNKECRKKFLVIYEGAGQYRWNRFTHTEKIKEE